MKRSQIFSKSLIHVGRSSQSRKRAMISRSELIFRTLENRYLLAATHDHELDAGLGDDYVQAHYSLIEPGTYLTPAQSGTPLEIASSFLSSQVAAFGLTLNDLEYRLASSSVSEQTGTTHLYLRQTHNGLDIFYAVINVSVANTGAVISAGSSFVATNSLATTGTMSIYPEISAAQALRTFALSAGFGIIDDIASTFFTSSKVPANVLRHSNSDIDLLEAPDISRNAIPAERVLIPVKDGLVSGWRLNVPLENGSHWYDAAVSAVDGAVLEVADWVSNANYVVFAAPKESPSDGGRTNRIDPQNPGSSPFGWHDTNGVAGAEFTTTKGNNVNAYTILMLITLLMPGLHRTVVLRCSSIFRSI